MPTMYEVADSLLKELEDEYGDCYLRYHYAEYPYKGNDKHSKAAYMTNVATDMRLINCYV